MTSASHTSEPTQTPRLTISAQLLRLVREPFHWLLLAATGLTLQLLSWQLSSLLVPIVGDHNWRQTDTYSVAYNFLHESADFFHPRIDWAENRSGIMGMEAPLFPYLLFLAMTLFGDAASVGRAVAWTLSAVGLGFFARYLLRTSSTRVGLLLMVLLSPMGLFELRQLQPDGPMMAMSVLAAACFHQFSRTERPRWLAAGVTAYSLAVLIKSPALAAGPAMWWLTWSARPTSLRQRVVRGLWLLLPLALWLAWTGWARHLNHTFNDGITYFAIDFRLAGMLADATDRGRLHHVFANILPSYVSNWVLFPACLTGFSLGFDEEQRPVAMPMALWALGAGLFLAAFSSRLASHWYYALVIFPPVMYFGALGLGQLFQLTRPAPPGSPLARWAGSLLVLTWLCVPCITGAPRKLASVPGGSRFPPNTTWTGELSLVLLLGLVVLTLGVSFQRAAATDRRHRPWLWLTLALVAGGVALPRAYHDVLESFKWRSRYDAWETAHTDWTGLRQAVDQYSTRNDRFVVTGGNPWYLHLPLRKGWADHTPGIDRRGLDWYAERGARFLVYYPETGRKPRGLGEQRLLARGPKWALYCLHELGCPPHASDTQHRRR